MLILESLLESEYLKSSYKNKEKDLMNIMKKLKTSSLNDAAFMLDISKLFYLNRGVENVKSTEKLYKII